MIESVPAGSAEVMSVAEAALKLALPNVVPPLLKISEPVGVPPNCPETAAVRVTDCCEVEGFGDEVRVVNEVALPTVWLTGAAVLPAKFVSPA